MDTLDKLLRLYRLNSKGEVSSIIDNAFTLFLGIVEKEMPIKDEVFEKKKKVIFEELGINPAKTLSS